MKSSLNDSIYFNKICQALVDYYMPGSIDYIYFLSTTKFDQKCPTGLHYVNKKTGARKNNGKNTQIKETKINIHALREQADP